MIVNEVSVSKSLPRLLLLFIAYYFELQYIALLFVLTTDSAEIIFATLKKQSRAQYVDAVACRQARRTVYRVILWPTIIFITKVLCSYIGLLSFCTFKRIDVIRKCRNSVSVQVFSRAWSVRNFSSPLFVIGCLSNPSIAARGHVATSAPASRHWIICCV